MLTVAPLRDAILDFLSLLRILNVLPAFLVACLPLKPDGRSNGLHLLSYAWRHGILTMVIIYLVYLGIL